MSWNFTLECILFLDLQQIATHARPATNSKGPTMSTADIGFFVLAEVLSVYNDRDKPEALIGAGSLALGREPCKELFGLGYSCAAPLGQGDFSNLRRVDGKLVGLWDRISQEHGSLTWEGPRTNFCELSVGEKLFVWPKPCLYRK